MKLLKSIFSIWTLIFVVGTSLYVFFRYDREREAILSNVDEMLAQASQSVKYILPEGFHHKAKRDGVSKEIDDANIRKLTEFARERNIRFIYSFTLSNTNVVFTSSSISEAESLDNPEVRYGFVFSEATPALKKAFHVTGKTSEEAEDRWGKFYAVYWTREEGKAKWVAGSEYRHDLYSDKLAVALIEAIRDVVFMGLLVLILLIPYFKRVRRRVASLVEEVDTSYTRYSKDILQRGR